MIAPGRFADILLVEDLAEFTADLVIARGQSRGRRWPAYWSTASISPIPNGLPIRSTWQSAYPLRISAWPAPDRWPQVTANVIGVIENQAPTRHLRLEVTPVKMVRSRPIWPAILPKSPWSSATRLPDGVQVGWCRVLASMRPAQSPPQSPMTATI